MKRCKKYIENTKLYEPSLFYSIEDIYNIYNKMKLAKFNESVDISILLKLDSKIQPIKGNITLPNGNGKKIRILLLVDNGDNNEELRKKYKVDKIGGSVFVKDILDKKINLIYDYVITTPKMFPQLKSIAKILGPKKIMPTMKNGTVTDNIEETVDNIQKGQISIKSNKEGIINLSLGRCSFTYQQIYDNFKSLYSHIIKMKDSNKKNIQIKRMSISTTMSPGIRVKLNKF
jgi:large subunit ribosomal protein L1